MIRFYDGFDDSTTATLGLIYSSLNIGGGDGTQGILVGAGRFGGTTKGIKCQTSYAGDSACVIKNLDVNEDSSVEMFYRICIKPVNFAGGSPHNVFDVRNASNSDRFKAEMRVDGSFIISKRDAGNNWVTYATTAPDLMQVSAYRVVEFRLRLHSTLGIFQMRIDEDLIPLTMASGVAATATAATNTDVISRFGFGGPGITGVPQTVYFDDVIFWDNTVNPDPLLAAYDPITWIGDVQCQTLFPDGVGSAADFTASPAVPSWQNVDDASSDGDTTRNIGTTIGQKELYSLTNPTGTVSSVLAVAVCSTRRKDSGSVREASSLLKSGATTDARPPKNVPTTYAQDFNATPVNKTTGVPFTPGELNTLESGLEITT